MGPRGVISVVYCKCVVCMPNLHKKVTDNPQMCHKCTQKPIRAGVFCVQRDLDVTTMCALFIGEATAMTNITTMYL